jgi:hypothetical protein
MVDFVEDRPSSRASRLLGGKGAQATRADKIKSATENTDKRRAGTATKKRDQTLKIQADEAMRHRKTSEAQLSISKRDRIISKIEREQSKRTTSKRHNESVSTLERINKSIQELIDVTALWGSIGAAGGFGGFANLLGLGGGKGKGKGKGKGRDGRRVQARDARGRFIKAGAKNAGQFGGLARIGTLGAAAAGAIGATGGLALAGAGAYFSTQSIMNNKGKGFLEGGLDSRAIGYLGNIIFGASAGAIVGGPVVAAIGAGVGLIGSVYVDYSKEINNWVGKRWKDVKKLGKKFAVGMTAVWTSTKSFFSDTAKSVGSWSASIPGIGAVGAFFASTPNAMKSAWDATQKFFAVDLPMGIEGWKKSIPGYTGVSTFMNEAGLGLNKTFTDLGSVKTGSDIKSALVRSLPFAVSPEEGNLRNKLKAFNEYKLGKKTLSSFRVGLTNETDRSLRSMKMKIVERIDALQKRKVDLGLFGDAFNEGPKIDTEIKMLKEVMAEIDGEERRETTAAKFIQETRVKSTAPTVRAPMTGLASTEVFPTTSGVTPSASSVDKVKKFGERAKIAAPTIREASNAYGVDFGYLMATAERESGFRTGIKAGSTSATGLFQFTDGTWKNMVSTYGKKHGLTLDGRSDPRQSTVAAALYTRDHAVRFESEFKKKPTNTDLYILHFFGDRDGFRFLRNLKKRPNDPAAPDFGNGGVFKNGKSTVSSANPTIFYHKGFQLSNDAQGRKYIVSGTPKSYQEVYNYFKGASNDEKVEAYKQEYGKFADDAMMAGGYGPEFEAQKAKLGSMSANETAGNKFANSALDDLMFRKNNKSSKYLTPAEEASETAKIKHVQGLIAAGKIPESELYGEYGISNKTKLLEKYGKGVTISSTPPAMKMGAYDVPSSTQAGMANAAAPRGPNSRSPRKQKPAAPTSMAYADTVAPENISFVARSDDGIAVLNLNGV